MNYCYACDDEPGEAEYVLLSAEVYKMPAAVRIEGVLEAVAVALGEEAEDVATCIMNNPLPNYCV